MIIRILTFQRANNYGAVLQCYALYSYIKKLNPDTKVLDYRNPYIEAQYNIVPRDGKIVKLLTFIVKRLLPSYNWQFLRKKRFETFRKYIDFTESITESELKEKGINCDLLISGSDQVLNPDITNGFNDVYYLAFSCTGIKATYAASIGGLNSQYIKSKLFFDKLDNIDFLSIREQDACDYIKCMSKKEVQQCVDPTLLLGKDEWDKIIGRTQYKGIPEDYILLYYLEKNQNLIDAAEKMSRVRKIPVLHFNKNAELNCVTKFCGDAGPLEFAWLIKHASVVITSSFHASVFSLLYEKEVYIMAHSKTGSRVVSLAELFDAKEIICTSLTEFETKSESHKNRSSNQRTLKVLRDESKKYIEYLIDKAEKINE